MSDPKRSNRSTKSGKPARKPAKRKISVRKAAVDVLLSIYRDEGTLSTLLPAAQSAVSTEDAALLQEMCFGVCRWSYALDDQLAPLLAKPLRRKDLDVRLLLQLGVYQLTRMRIKPHAVLNETVAVAAELGKPWASGLVNAVLRNHLRKQEEAEKTPAENTAMADSARYSHPDWMIEKLREDWPACWQEILAAGNQRPPLVLRKNRLAMPKDLYVEQLSEGGIGSRELSGVPDALVIPKALPVDELPGFFNGEVSVQDGAAQYAVELIRPRLIAAKTPGSPLRVLDACAAPGGKTGHLLEIEAVTEVVAVDSHAGRLQRVNQNLQRLSLSSRATVVCSDAATPAQWWDGSQFDCVLLDAPCSGSGVVRRHPDIKIVRQQSDLETLVDSQYNLLQALWPLVKTGGCLLYVTCSVFDIENERQIQRFLHAVDGVTVVPLQHPAGDQRYAFEQPDSIEPAGLQILTGENDMDGFYYCLLEKA